MTHPRHHKTKTYEVELNKPLTKEDAAHITKGIQLDDGASALDLNGHDTQWIVAMHEGRNRQIRRTFKSLGYTVTELHRTHFGPYDIATLDGAVYIDCKDAVDDFYKYCVIYKSDLLFLSFLC